VHSPHGTIESDLPPDARPGTNTDEPPSQQTVRSAPTVEPVIETPARPAAPAAHGAAPLAPAPTLPLSSAVGSLVTRPTVVVDPDAAVADVARALRAAGVRAALVRDAVTQPGNGVARGAGGGATGRPVGIVTDGDLRDRVLAERLDPSTPVSAVMTTPVRSLPAEAPAYAALTMMLDEGYGQVPVVADGEPIGLVTQEDVLRLRSEDTVLLLGRLHNLGHLDRLDEYAEQVATTARDLVAEGVDAVRVARVIAGMNDALTACLLRLTERSLGPAPMPYAWLALGSEGRQEQVLLSDQDNALAYAEDSPAAGAYFPELARVVVDGLERAGFARCPGGYMAVTWVHPLDRWAEIVRTWVRNPEPDALVEAAVFLDFRPAHGDLAVDSLHRILMAAGQSPPFLAALARAAIRFPPPLGTFGRVRAPDGLVDLKRAGLTSMVILARLFALEAGSTARPTVDRLADACARGVISERTAEMLTDGFRFLTHVRLRQQLQQRAAGAPVQNQVRLADLGWLEQRRLTETFRALNEVLKTTRVRLHAD
jgi:CBS domain-containing protein